MGVDLWKLDLASGTTLWTGDYPVSLGGTSVTIDGKPAYLSLVSPTQINFQAPNDTTTGSVPVVVKTQNGSVTSTVTLAAARSLAFPARLQTRCGHHSEIERNRRIWRRDV